MNRQQLDLIPDHLLRHRAAGCGPLLDWLRARGWHMTLLELDTERRYRRDTKGTHL
jgi:hypothetical protein